MRRMLPLALPLVLAGCLEAGDLVSRNKAPDYGSAIQQTECQTIAKRHVGPTLLKPDRARYKFGRCMADTLSPNILLGIGAQSGYAMSFEVAAENGFGRSTGFRSYEILIHNGEVVRRLRRNIESGMWERF